MALVPRNFSDPSIDGKTHNKVPRIDANTRDFEAELAAQEADPAREKTELHPEATVVTATAL